MEERIEKDWVRGEEEGERGAKRERESYECSTVGTDADNGVLRDTTTGGPAQELKERLLW